MVIFHSYVSLPEGTHFFRVNYETVSLTCHFLDASCPIFFKDFRVVRTRLHWLSLVALGRFFSDQPRLFFIFHFIYGMSSFPLTNSYFSRLFFNHQPVMTGRKFFRAACSFNPFVRRMVGPRIPSWSYSSRQLKVKLII